MRSQQSLSELSWTVSGYTPTSWNMARSMELGVFATPEVAPVPMQVPGSIQRALREAGHIPDWNKGLNFRLCEWVENRDWCVSTLIPDGWLNQESDCKLVCLGLDSCGVVLLNGEKVASFNNGLHQHRFDLNDTIKPGENRLDIMFTVPPRWNGTPNISSSIHDWKARFNYSWDWMPRNVQIGIWDDILIEQRQGAAMNSVRCEASIDALGDTGTLRLQGEVFYAQDVTVNVHVDGPLGILAEKTFSGTEFEGGVTLDGLSVIRWEPNRHNGADPALYRVTLTVVNTESGLVEDTHQCNVGFRHVAWQPCHQAPDGADPWLCVVNNEPTFLCGVNWTPIRAHYADVTEAMYRERLELYRDAGFNCLRVWGGAFLEKRCFYEMCDEMGLFVWQDFPLSSSGPDNSPPHDIESLCAMETIATDYIRRRRHHASLLLWCGGNELQTTPDDQPGTGKPLTTAHPMLGMLAGLVKRMDPSRRYVASSSSGPTFTADDRFGEGVHWDVHGPWRMPGDTVEAAESYWANDDALFRSETGHPSASSMEILNKYHSDYAAEPVTMDNPLWRTTFWWIEDKHYKAAHGHAPKQTQDYVEWTQSQQSKALGLSLSGSLKRFPDIGGVLFWMGHDSWPCGANTSIIDFDGKPKPAYFALRDILNKSAQSETKFV